MINAELPPEPTLPRIINAELPPEPTLPRIINAESPPEPAIPRMINAEKPPDSGRTPAWIMHQADRGRRQAVVRG